MIEVEQNQLVTIAGQEVKINDVVAKSGYRHSAVFCRNMCELEGIITHGIFGIRKRLELDKKENEQLAVKFNDYFHQHDRLMSEEDIRRVLSLLIEQKRVETTTDIDGSIHWNIHSVDYMVEQSRK
jgi:hypothetical protein